MTPSNQHSAEAIAAYPVSAEPGEFEPNTDQAREAFILGSYEEDSGSDFDLWLARHVAERERTAFDRGRESKQHTDRETLIDTIARALRPDAFWNETADYPTSTRDDWEAGQAVARMEAEPVAAAILAAPSLSLVAVRDEVEAVLIQQGVNSIDGADPETVTNALFASNTLKPSSEVEAAALARAWERGIHDLHEHKRIYDAWRYNYRDYPGDGPTNPHSGEVFHRTDVQHRPDWWVNPYPADADSTIEAARVRSGKDEA